MKAVPQLTPAMTLARVETLSASLGTTVTCQERYQDRVLGIDCARSLGSGHYMSAGLMSFTRGLNDTQKIAALFVVAPEITPVGTLSLCGVAIAIDGAISSRRVAETMSHRITAVNAGQGFTVNLITAATMIIVSQLSLPVSTTHVSCGSLFGLGTVTGKVEWGGISKIVLAWIVNLPTTAAIVASSFYLLHS